jgi:AraC-like DNA-binding protein
MDIRQLVAGAVDLLGEAVRQITIDHEARSTILRAHQMLSLQAADSRCLAQQKHKGCVLLAWQTRRITQYMREHLATKIRVSHLSAVVGLSEGHFARAFKNAFGVGPHTFLTRLRVEEASRLMISTSGSLCEISLACGFSDQAHLCKAFRHAMGVNPSSWRRQRNLFAVNG